ncbi:MAG: hypothetical protein RIS47_966 [Bacteroidota bacterium]
MNRLEPFTEKQLQISRLAKALSHPVRVFVIQFLAEQSCCYSGDLTDILPIAKSTLSQHLKELKEAGLIEGELETPKIRYCLHKENWEIAKENLKSFINIDISCSSDCK